MIVIKDAYYKAGYSRADHLLDSSELADLIGISVASVGVAERRAYAIQRAARKAQPRCGGEHSARIPSVPIGLRVRYADGEERVV